VSRVFWDTNLFIYLWEWEGELNDRVVALRKRMIERGDQLCTSTITLGEVLVKPKREKRPDLVRKYEQALSSHAVTLIPFDRDCARIYADLRLGKSLKAPDAIQLACAAHARCDMFITNDDRLSRYVVPGIHFVVSLNHAFL